MNIFDKIPVSIKRVYFIIAVLLIVAELIFIGKMIKDKIIYKDILPFGYCKDCNVIILSIIPLRSKSLPCYGYSKNTSPFLCKFAEKSFLFKNSYSQSGYTLDSHGSIVTSLYPSSHKMITPFKSTLSDKIIPLPQLLHDFGYYNYYAGSNDPNLLMTSGYKRGFDEIIPASSPSDWISTLKNSIQKQNFFSFFQAYSVHEPYLPQKENFNNFYSGSFSEFVTKEQLCTKAVAEIAKIYPERIDEIKISGNKISDCDIFYRYDELYSNRDMDPKQFEDYYRLQMDTYWNNFAEIEANLKPEYMQALYDTKIYEMDLELNKFFDYLERSNLFKNTIVIFTSHHGESFYEHGTWTHGANIYNEVIRVPLIIYVPNTKPMVIDKLAQGIDLFPTLLYLLGIKDGQLEKQITGISLFSKAENEYVLSQHYADRKYALIGKEWKLIINNDNPDGQVTKELYNLVTDPEEKENLAQTNPGLVNSMEKTLKNILNKQPKYEQKTQPFPTWIDKEQRRKLIETGYF